jgi:hypothetical protein
MNYVKDNSKYECKFVISISYDIRKYGSGPLICTKIDVNECIIRQPKLSTTTSFLLDDNDKFIDIPIDYQCMISGNPTLTPKQIYQLNRNKKLPDAPYEFAYAYAITTHKAQGSEWDKVLVIEEPFPFSVEDHKKWLYTACTRAKEKLVVIAK